MATAEERKELRDISAQLSGQGEILARLDERSNNTWKIVDKIEKHQTEQNDSISECVKQVAKNTVRIAKNTTWLVVFRWIMGIGFAGMVSWMMHLSGVW